MTRILEINRGPNAMNEDELTLVSDYLGGFMTAEGEAEFEQRLIDDAGFFSRVSPVINAFYMTGPLPVELLAAKEIDRMLARRRWTRHLTKAVGGMAAAAALVLVVNSTVRRISVTSPTVAEGSNGRKAASTERQPPVVAQLPPEARIPSARSARLTTKSAALATRDPTTVAALPSVAETNAERAAAQSADASLSLTLPAPLDLPVEVTLAPPTLIGVFRKLESLNTVPAIGPAGPDGAAPNANTRGAKCNWLQAILKRCR